MRQKIILGNWKMNGSRALLASLLPPLLRESFGSARVGVCPPVAYLGQVAAIIEGSSLELGAQNVNEHDKGAYTGETSVSMLKELGCRYVLVGHSERRQYFGETDAIVAEKFAIIRRSGLIPVLCIGETQEERDQDQTDQVVFRQIDAVQAHIGSDAFANAIIAYEPVWAIGTGKTATPAQAQDVHQLIRRHIAETAAGDAESLPLLYGGSMKAANAAELLAMADIDGGLVGGASLDSREFIDICRAAA